MRHLGGLVIVFVSAAVAVKAQSALLSLDLSAEPRRGEEKKIGPKPPGWHRYLATLAGAWRSVDGGLNWSRMATLTAPNVWGIAVHPTSPGVVYASTNDNGVWRSTNFGSTWQGVSPALTAYSVAIDPTSPNRVYAATRTGVWWSGDDGLTWQSSGLTDRGAYSIVADSGVLYAGTTLGAAISYDGSATWIDADPGLGGAGAFGYAITADPNTEGS